MSYVFVIDLFKKLLGFDPALILNLGLLFAACSTTFHYFRGLVYYIASSYFTSSVDIDGIDPVYSYIVQWMTTHQVSMASKTVKATTRPQNVQWDNESLNEDRQSIREGRDLKSHDNGPINYRTTNKLPIRFLPEGQYTFWYRGNFFIYQHSTILRQQRTDLLNHDNVINLHCWGWSLKPLRDLLQVAQDEFIDAQGSGTRIFRSTSNSGGGFQWNHTGVRPARSLDTVIMDETKKQALVNDINEYLLSTTRKWYAAHGIPYRRGYLFSGKPGTGKSSLAFSLAGVFGLPIYSLTLADPNMIDSELVGLFSTLPGRCVVLLEDIDSAGLEKRSLDGDEVGQVHLPKYKNGIKTASSSSQSGLSLSGLLNTIDGVASQEGRVLIMTTNSPEVLDPALIRPGRVDMEIYFEFATRGQIRLFFLAIYQKSVPISSDDHVDEKSSLPALADTFAASLPPGRFSLAAVQGYLLCYKKDPHKAVINAKSWSMDMLKGDKH